MNLTPKQERFCQAIVAGENQSQAYRTAYDAEKMAPDTVWKRASEMMNGKGEVAGRIKELRAPVVEATQWGLKEAMAESEEARLVGKSCDEGGVMIQATTLKSKLTGLLIEKPAASLSVLEVAATDLLVAMLADYQAQRAPKEITDASRG